MKTISVFAFALLAVLGTASAQQTTAWKIYQPNAKLTVTTYVEQTHIGPKAGTAVGVEFRNLMTLGAFYQESSLFENGNEKTELPSQYEQQFFGVYASAPLYQGRLIGFDFNVRTGMTNGENFTITPSVLSSFKLASFIEVGGGLGMRAFRPTVQSSVTIKF